MRVTGKTREQLIEIINGLEDQVAAIREEDRLRQEKIVIDDFANVARLRQQRDERELLQKRIDELEIFRTEDDDYLEQALAKITESRKAIKSLALLL